MTPLTKEEERRLVRRLRRRDERAFTELVKHFQTPVYNVTFRMMGNNREEALDVSQEVFVTIFRAIEGFRGDSKLSTWIYRIAVNHCRNRIKYLVRRKRGRHDALDDIQETRVSGGDAFASGIAMPDKELEGREAERVLKSAIEQLDPEQREVLVLRDIQGMTYDEIASATGAKAGTVKSRLHRARTALQGALRAWRGETVDE